MTEREPESDVDAHIARLMDAAGFSHERARQIVVGTVRPFDATELATGAIIVGAHTRRRYVPDSLPSDSQTDPHWNTPKFQLSAEQIAINTTGIAQVHAVGEFASRPEIKALPKLEREKVIADFALSLEVID